MLLYLLLLLWLESILELLNPLLYLLLMLLFKSILELLDMLLYLLLLVLLEFILAVSVAVVGVRSWPDGPVAVFVGASVRPLSEGIPLTNL